MSDPHLSSKKVGSTNTNRRTLVKAALSAPPVLATLVSKPVQAVQGLSNMLSGDASVCRGDNRYGGQSPGFWKALTGKTDPVVYMESTVVHDAESAWNLTGYQYGTLKAGGNKNKWEDYEGGSLYSDVFGSGPYEPLRVVLNNTQTYGTDAFHLIAGLLNARYFEAISFNGDTQYIFSTQQFWSMYEGNLSIPPAYSSLIDLIESNYHYLPGSDCS